MRKPEMTKKTSTPRKPPGSQRGSRWKAMTAATASARRPSRPGSRPVDPVGGVAGRGSVATAPPLPVGLDRLHARNGSDGW